MQQQQQQQQGTRKRTTVQTIKATLKPYGMLLLSCTACGLQACASNVS